MTKANYEGRFNLVLTDLDCEISFKTVKIHEHHFREHGSRQAGITLE